MFTDGLAVHARNQKRLRHVVDFDDSHDRLHVLRRARAQLAKNRRAGNETNGGINRQVHVTGQRRHLAGNQRGARELDHRCRRPDIQVEYETVPEEWSADK